jgi:large repetitive protein
VEREHWLLFPQFFAERKPQMSLRPAWSFGAVARRHGVRVVISAICATSLASWVLVGALPGTASATGVNIALVQEPFTGSTVLEPNDWSLPGTPSGTNVACLTAGTSTSETPIPGCGGSADAAGRGALRLTRVATNEEGGVADLEALPSSQGLDVSFETYQYGNASNADGIMFYLAASNPADPQVGAVLGEPGGHLAYSGGSGAPTGAGMVDGYLGIGFDVYGNYANKAYDGSGCTDPTWAGNNKVVPNAVSVRGPGSSTAGYCLLSSTLANGALQGNLGTGGPGTRATSLVPAEVAINPTGAPITTTSGLVVAPDSYVVAVTPIGGPTQTISGALPSDDAYVPAGWLNSNGVPLQMVFGFAASTGGSDDIHEVTDAQAAPLNANPPQFGVSLADSEAGVLVQGSSLTYTVSPSVSLSAGSEPNPPTLVTTLPSGVTPGAASGTDWSCSTTVQTVTCLYSVPAIAAGTSLPVVSIPAMVSAGATGALTASATTLWENSAVGARASDPGTATAVAQSTPALGLTFADNDAGQLLQGQSVTYTATGEVSSEGAAEADAPTFTATFPSDESLGAASGTNWSCTNSSQTVTCDWTGGPIAVGTSLGPISMPVTVSTAATGAAAVTGALSSADASPGSVSVTDDAVIASTPTLGISLTANKSGYLALSSTVDYTVIASVASLGWNEADAPVVTDSFPPVFSSVTKDPSSTDWSCSQTAGARITETCAYMGPLPAVSGASLAPLTFDNVVEASGAAGTTANDWASVVSNDAPTAVATASGTIEPVAPVMVLSTSGTPATAGPGTSYHLTLVPSLAASPAGPADHGPVLTVTLPAGETFAASAPTPAGWSCAVTSGATVLTCTSTAPVPVAAGTALGPVTVGVYVGSVTGTLTTTATLSDPGDGATASTQTPSTAGTSPASSGQQPPVLRITESAPASVVAGGSFGLDLGVSLASAGGPADSDPSFSVDLPSSETFASPPSAANWACSVSAGKAALSCTWDGLLPLAQGSALGQLMATVDVSPAASGPATIIADSADGGSTSTATATIVVSTAAAPPSKGFGYRLVGSDGGVFDFSAARFHESCPVKDERCRVLAAKAVGMATSPGGKGYWLVGADGGVFAFGSARFYGSCPGSGHPCGRLSAPIVGISPVSNGHGYWLVGANGAVFAFGAAKFMGSCSTAAKSCGALTAPIVGIAAAPGDSGYWLDSARGDVFAFGNVHSFGACPVPGSRCQKLVSPMVGMAATPDGRGYWLVAGDGGVFAFGSAHFLGNTYTAKVEKRLVGPVTGITVMPDGRGYWLVASDGGVFAFGSARFLGNTYTAKVEKRLVGRVTGIAYSVAG